ncbi:MAG: thiol peroxidase [Bacteroidetes bacterium]|jgi:thiol peroxidase|nr:thiol peroxidase [Bacteroidota bacterium]
MAQVTLKGNPLNTYGDLPAVGSTPAEFTAVKNDLSELKLSDYAGKNVVLNIFQSLDTSTCANSVKRFNKEAANLSDTVVLCLSKDLPFAHQRFCETEGINNVVNGSLFRNQEFGKQYGNEIVDGPARGLVARSLIVINKEGKVVHSQQVQELSEEPDYESALSAIK